MIPTGIYILVALLVVILIVIKSIYPQQSRLSRFELKRRVELEDAEAKQALLHMDSYWQFVGVLRLKEVVVVMAITALLFSMYGWLSIVLALLLWVAASWLASIRWLQHFTNKYFDQYRLPVAEKVSKMAWLCILAGKHEEVSPIISSRPELLYRVRTSRLLSRTEYDSLEALLTQDKRTAEQVMIKIDNVDTVEDTELLGPLTLDTLHKTGHHVFPVTNQAGAIVGTLDLGRDVDLHMTKRRVLDCMNHDIDTVSTTLPVRDVLSFMLKDHHFLAVVVDSQRVVCGVIFLRDVAEAVAGKLSYEAKQ